MPETKLHNIIIIGGGIAAHTAALYNARADLEPLVIAGLETDQLSLTTIVENFPGFIDGVMGPQLIADAKKQAEKFGAKYLTEFAGAIEINENIFTVKTGGNQYQTKALIVATGASPRWLGVKGEKENVGKGVSTCATCDAAFYRDKTAVIVGGGDSAMEEALVLTKFAAKVIIIHRRDKFNASQIMQDRVFAQKDKIEVIWNTAVTEVLTDGQFVNAVKLENSQTGKTTELKTDGIFLAIGHVPATAMFQNLLTLDEQGYIVTDCAKKTNIEGIFAAGDCQDPYFRQAIVAAGAGAQAALSAEKYLQDKE
ncbi:MAG: thioredoxin-disulfide reductase [Patescibacteria group bacterium]|jgi:thioredoxin reductase (NADPH)|nr:thioredoxin-disulfide reductase [Patescibacteria group bacterium]